jgi:polar amino acid transport system substrate-binding protein
LADPATAPRITNLTNRVGGWQMIAAGRIDGMLADRLTAMREIARLGLGDAIVKSPLVFHVDAAAVAFSKRSVTAEFVAKFDQALKTMLKDGSYKRIYEQHVDCKVTAAALGCR